MLTQQIDGILADPVPPAGDETALHVWLERHNSHATGDTHGLRYGVEQLRAICDNGGDFATSDRVDALTAVATYLAGVFPAIAAAADIRIRELEPVLQLHLHACLTAPTGLTLANLPDMLSAAMVPSPAEIRELIDGNTTVERYLSAARTLLQQQLSGLRSATPGWLTEWSRTWQLPNLTSTDGYETFGDWFIGETEERILVEVREAITEWLSATRRTFRQLQGRYVILDEKADVWRLTAPHLGFLSDGALQEYFTRLLRNGRVAGTHLTVVPAPAVAGASTWRHNTDGMSLIDVVPDADVLATAGALLLDGTTSHVTEAVTCAELLRPNS
jgi:hypothetical protein